MKLLTLHNYINSITGSGFLKLLPQVTFLHYFSPLPLLPTIKATIHIVFSYLGNIFLIRRCSPILLIVILFMGCTSPTAPTKSDPVRYTVTDTVKVLEVED